MLRKEVLRQFKEIPYLMESKTYPDMKKISNFQTIYSLRLLTLPSMCIVIPMIMVVVYGNRDLLHGFLLSCLIIALTQGFTWSIIGDLVYNVSLKIDEGFFGGENSRSQKNVVYALEYASIYNEALAPNHNVLIKLISLSFVMFS